MTWQPIAGEPRDDTLRLVTDDPADAERAELVRRWVQPGMFEHPPAEGDVVKHFNGDVVIEHMGMTPTHWHPIPVDEKISR